MAIGTVELGRPYIVHRLSFKEDAPVRTGM